MNLTAVMAAGMSLASLDAQCVEAAAQRLRAVVRLLGDASLTVRRSSVSGWSGAGHDAWQRAAGDVTSRLDGLKAALETAALVLTAFAASLRSVQAEVSAARRVLASAGPAAAAEPVAGQLQLAELAFDDTDRRTAAILDHTLGPALIVSPGSAGLGSTRSALGQAEALARDIAVVPPLPALPAAVALWWAGLSAASRRSVTASWPQPLGGIDGIPARVRDSINRRRLELELAAQSRRSAGWGWSRQLTVSVPTALPWPLSSLARLLSPPQPARTAALQQLTLTLRKPGSELLVFDAAGDGRAVVSTGDVDTAAAVGVLVPGMDTDLADVPALTREGRALAAAAGSGAVAVAWLGYDAPGIRQVISDRRARSAAGPLRRFVTGLRSTSAARQHLTVVGHSYGTLVAGIAARRSLEADDLVLLASPGVEADTAAELGLPPSHVWAARAATDPIQVVFWPSRIGKALGIGVPTVFGPDPAAAAFGARHFDIGGAYGHSGYFTPGSRSLASIGRIVGSSPGR